MIEFSNAHVLTLGILRRIGQIMTALLDLETMANAAGRPNDFALLIAFGVYHSKELVDLPAVPNDHDDVKAWLEREAGLSSQNIFSVCCRSSADVARCDYNSVDEAYRRMLEKASAERTPGQPAGRLYFYFAGHGGRNAQNETLLLALPRQSRWSTPDNLSITEFWTATRQAGIFDELFQIVDSCARSDSRAGGMGPSQRFVFTPDRVAKAEFYRATIPEQIAREGNIAGDERGFFTISLCNGLRGEASEKDAAVGWSISRDSLERFVRWRLKAWRLEIRPTVRGQSPSFNGEGRPASEAIFIGREPGRGCLRPAQKCRLIVKDGSGAVRYEGECEPHEPIFLPPGDYELTHSVNGTSAVSSMSVQPGRVVQF